MSGFTCKPYWSGLLTIAVLTQGCTITEPLRTEPYESGVVVLDAHQQNKLGSLSFINRQSGLARFTSPKPGTLSTDIFNNSNDRPLLDSVFSCASVGGKDFLVVPGREAVEIVESSTYRGISLLGGVEGGRYVVGATELKGYVSFWGGKNLSAGVGVIDLTERRIRNRISTPAGPEQMVVVGNELFVIHSGGNTEVGKTISVINTITDQVVASISVGDVPTSLLYDAATNQLYVLCSGRSVNSSANGLTTAELIRIDPSTRRIVGRVLIGGRAIAGNPTNLTFDPNTLSLYFLWRKAVYKVPALATSIPLDQPLIGRPVSALGFDPIASVLYTATTNRSAKPAVILRYRSTGTLIDSITTEVVPTGFFAK
jgi:YVTN family beta-propeller protein